MKDKLLEARGLLVPSGTLELPRSRALAQVLETGRLAFIQPVEYRCESADTGHTSETIVFDVEVERPQKCVHPIHRVERIAVRFDAEDNWYPEVVSLRSDFPQVPHLNLRDCEFPRSLCLYDQSWSEIALRWTPVEFVERIRTWLAETAKGTLHQSDQPLEPVLAGSGLSIILPPDLFADWDERAVKHLQVGRATPEDGCRVMSTNPDPRAGGLSVVAVCLIANPRAHAAIRRRPKHLPNCMSCSLRTAVTCVNSYGLNLNQLRLNIDGTASCLSSLLFRCLVRLGLEVEVTSVWAFLSPKSVAEVGIAIGLWIKMPGNDKRLGSAMGEMPDAIGTDVEVEVIAPQFGLSRQSAAAASAEEPAECKTVAIGAGALGSAGNSHTCASRIWLVDYR